ncbi:MAG: ADP-glyceromanno-heptose 6-epimerase [Desulfovibrionaceae bacterium]
MYVITGGAGFLGSALVWHLNQRGVDNIIVVDNLAHSEKWKNLVNRRYVDYIHKDAFIAMVRRNALPFHLKGVVHLGACSSTTETNADYLMENNFHYTRDLCTYALHKGARFINASSAATYGDGAQGFQAEGEAVYALKPLNMYGYSKHLVDLWLLRHGLDTSVASLKFFNVYGPNEYHKGDMCSVISKAYTQIQETGCLRLFKSTAPEYADGGQLRDFVYVKDCAALMDWLLQQESVCGIRNVGTGQARSWNDLAAAVFGAMHREVCIEYVDMPVHLHGKYQNFTQADMTWLKGSACPVPWHGLEAGVRDYVQNYLAGADAYL